MDQVLGQTMQSRRFFAGLMAAFGGVALLLAAIGLYGVIAYGVAQLKLTPAAGAEAVALDAYLAGRASGTPARTVVADSALAADDPVAAYLNPKES